MVIPTSSACFLDSKSSSIIIMNKSEEASTSKPENGVDMMSSLPNPFLELILSGIPIHEVVRTSILSKRWRYLYKSIPYFPSLHVECSIHLCRLSGNEKNNNNFREFVYRALEKYKTVLDLQTLRLSGWTYYSEWVEKLIEVAVMRKVKSIDLKIRPVFTKPVELPDCMVNCDSLESLRLGMFIRSFTFPSGVRFSALRVLEFNGVYFYDYDITEVPFLKSCPLLEDFSMIDCFMGKPDPLRVSCPNLKTLRIYNSRKCRFVVSCPKLVIIEYVNCPGDHLFFENLHSLKRAMIFPNNDYFSSKLGNHLCNLLAVISHVESLTFNHCFIQAMSTASDPKRYFPASLPKLKTLELTTTIQAFTVNVIIRILKCSPVLESFRLIIQEEFLTAKYWESCEVKTRIILTRHLKRVEFLEFNGEIQKLGIARFLLEHGNALEEMVFSWRDKVKYLEKATETMNLVSEFQKASSTVKLIALHKD